MKLFKLTAIMSLSMVAPLAMAADNTVSNIFSEGNPLSVSAEIGTFGYGGNIGWSVDDSVELQLGYSGGDLFELAGEDASIEVDEVDFNVKTDFSVPYLGVQLRPMKNWLTVGYGIQFVGDSSFMNAVAAPKKDVDVEYNGNMYKIKSDATLDTSVSFKNSVAPYATLGFHPNINNRFGLFAEVGAAYTGGINVDVEADGTFTKNGKPTKLDESQIKQLESDAEKEIRDELDDASDFKFTPMIKVGATVRF